MLFSAALCAGMGTGSAVSKQTIFLKADRRQVAFFDRPVAIAAARASSKPYPLIVMLKSDPWLMVIRSDSPAFALYSDGTAIFRTRTGFESTKLDQTQQADLLRAFENPELATLAGGYDAADATDQPDNRLLVYGKRSAVLYLSLWVTRRQIGARKTSPSNNGGLRYLTEIPCLKRPRLVAG